MSNERSNREDTQLVSDTYKAMASERAPDHLNEQVLRQAARDGRTRYARARAWMRPVAWAATIGLSLAIVLELARLPSIEPDAIGIAAPVKESADENERKADQGAATEVPKNDPASVPTADHVEARRSRPATPAEVRPDRLSKDEFVPQDMAVLREAENMARAQAGPDQAPNAPRAQANDAVVEDVSAEDVSAEDIPAVASFAVLARKKALQSDLACPVEARESAESWWVCIKTLRENGRDDLADAEYEEFQQIFPDFVDSQVE